MQTAIVARGDEWLPPLQLCARDGGYPNMAMTHRVFALSAFFKIVVCAVAMRIGWQEVDRAA